jgi:hypothetical protein
MTDVTAASLGAMGRHGTPPPPRQLPWGLVGWCAFAGVVAAAALLVMGESWVSALLVLCTGAAGLGIVVVLALVAPRSGASSGHRRAGP